MQFRYLTILAVIAVLTGCNNSHKAPDSFMDFPVVEEAQWQYISDEDEIVPYPFAIFVNDSTINLIGKIEEMLFHTYSKTDGKLLSSTLQQGPGPDEVISPRDVIRDNDGGLWIFDLSVMKFKHFDKNWNILDVRQLRNNFLVAENAWPTTGNRYITSGYKGYGVNAARTYNIVDSASDSVMYTYSKLESPFDSNPGMIVHSEPARAISPDGRRIAALSRYGVAAEFMEVAGDSIIATVSELLVPQEFIETNGIRRLPDMKDRFIGFGPPYVTDRYVYGPYAGAKGAFGADKICIWDWEGNPVKMIKTDAYIANIAIDPADNSIYAVVFTPEEHERRLARLKQ